MSNIDIVDKVVRFMYNESPSKIFDLVYGVDHVEHYKKEKMAYMKSFIHWWGSLDDDHRARLVQVAIDRDR